MNESEFRTVLPFPTILTFEILKRETTEWWLFVRPILFLLSPWHGNLELEEVSAL